MTASDHLRAVWVSGAFGFGDDLAYFREVLGQFARRFPDAVVLVREGYPVDRYPELPLAPDLRFWVRRRDRSVGEFTYTGNLRIPTFRTAWRMLRRPTDVVVVVEFTPTALVSATAAHLRRRRVVQLIESDPSFRGGRDGRIATTVKRAFARRSHVVLVSNDRTARYARERLGIRAERLRIGPYLTSQPAQPSTGSDDGGSVRFLFLNSLQRRKGLHLLLAALAELPAHTRDWTLDVVGDGPERARLEGQAVELGLAERVRFHGRRSHDEVAADYARSHVVVCPTQGDYRSLAGFEAVNARRPVVLSTRDGAAEEIVDSGAAAVAVDPVERRALAAVLASFLQDDTHLAKQLEIASVPPGRFSVEVVGANLESAIRAAVR
ncbi:glycosyltransferase family 4 protein [Microbacterium trichothecenolyticum]|uniref:glycosyltransferase family 4 protein n=1 Tax=Microbacterium trichothecenolyticum TaxID=69370 RepID=UPI001C6F2632|nr:glycosyltransferase family 4 protein [Microbacterium trichothecenolyticum]MBW9121133.1 glycosyltransferase family 4 protein [Microbacterium trichothecenolyticum]